jgi:hypothetical protein
MNPKQVREDLQHKYGLRVLRIYMDRGAADKAIAVFTLIGHDGEEAGLLTASLTELGFGAPSGGRVSAALPDCFHIPRHVVAALRGWLDEDAVSQEPLWLRLSVPIGLLAAVPWEELLQPALGVPILRLPYQSIYPRRPPAASNTLVCFSSPCEGPGLRRRVDEFVGQVPLDLAQATQFHLFGDRAAYPALLELQRKHAGIVDIKVYDPAAAPSFDQALSRNPWLFWMLKEMGEGRVDVVHFLCYSDYYLDTGALRLASGPADVPGQPQPCLVRGPELIDFLDHVGAWCVAFTSAPAEKSAAGMRLLQTEIARRRPGPVLVHDMNVAGSPGALGEAYRFLFSGNRRPPAAPGLALYCHPILTSDRDFDEESQQQLTRFTLDGRLGAELHNNSLPGWVLSSQRKLEVSAGSLSDAQAECADSGRVRARTLVLDAVTDYARELGAQGRITGEK